MLTASVLALSAIVMGPTPVTNVRTAGDIIEIRTGMIDGANDTRRDQVRDFDREPTKVVGSIADGALVWDGADSDRERLGGQDAPELILVRAFDGVFAIDPFVQLPQGDIGLMRQLFSGTSLDTDRALFDRRRIERTEELMKILESARMNWLRDNGYYSARTVRNPNAGKSTSEGASLPEPSGWFRTPDDMPRTQPEEQVQAEPSKNRRAAIASSLLSGDEPIRISLPFGTAPDVVASAARRSTTEVAAR
ncbi:MAG: hypothetical protein AB8F26_06440 [Phycisphaerales bacterium]